MNNSADDVVESVEVNQIPIQNIYHLLVYAYGRARFDGMVSVDAERCPNAVNLLASVLGNLLLQIPRRGLSKHYNSVVEDSRRIRGRIDIFLSRQRQTEKRASLICSFDELSIDTPENCIIKATCRMLLCNRGAALSADNQELIFNAQKPFERAAEIVLSADSFRQVRLSRNTKHYEFAIQICRILFDLGVPTKSGEIAQFQDLLKTKNAMARLFEDFVMGFCRFHFPLARISKRQVTWDAVCFDGSESVLPRMETDVAIDHGDSKLIVECKYYKDGALSLGGSIYDGGKLRSAHLYQLVSYLSHQSRQPGWSCVKGLLLYPVVRNIDDYHFLMLGHDVWIRSLNLNQDWQRVEEDLLRFLGSHEVFSC